MRVNLLGNLVIGLLFSGGLCVAQAQTNYTVDWFKVAGGGGTSTGGTYQISGTIGQHDASGSLTSGNYALTGGFWSIYALQMLGAPTLSVTFVAPGSVVVSWPSPSTDFVLQQNSNLGTTKDEHLGGMDTWTLSSYPITTNGDIQSITITSPPPGCLFFRLKD